MGKRLIVKKGALIGRLLAQPHGTFTPPAVCRSPTHCLRRFERSDCGYKGVSLCILRVVANKPLHLFSGAVLIAQLSGHENPARIVSSRTRRVARRKRNVSDLPYAASPLSCVAFFVKVQVRLCPASSGKGDAACFLLNLEREDSPHKP